jgi:hypothetical protein
MCKARKREILEPGVATGTEGMKEIRCHTMKEGLLETIVEVCPNTTGNQLRNWLLYESCLQVETMHQQTQGIF